MTCKDCASENQQYFPGELTLAFPSIESLKLSTGYASPEILVCLECGYTELVIPVQRVPGERLNSPVPLFWL
jgi:hypothetical protein